MKNTTLFVLINMFSGMGYSLVSPLFPSLGKEDNLSEEILGWIISTYSISSTLTTPFIPVLSKRISRIKLLCFATFCEATCTLLYGFLTFIPNHLLLLIIIFFLRILHGICSALIGTLVYSLTMSLANPDELNLSIGNLEVGWCLGTSSGPVFASFFYTIGGFSLPFIVLGLFLYVSVYLAYEIDSTKLVINEENEDDPPFVSLLIKPKIFLVFFGFVTVMLISSFYYPCLSNHLTKNYNLSISMASLFFVLPVVAYIFLLQFLDAITAFLGIFNTFTYGLLIISISCLFIYPCPPIPKNIIFIIIGFLLLGLGTGPVLVPGLIVLTKNLVLVDPSIDQITAGDIAAAINTLTLDIGEFIGPIFGGFVTSRYSFKYCCYILFILGISFTVIFFLYFFENIKNEFFLYGKKEEEIEDEKKDGLINTLYRDAVNDDIMSCKSVLQPQNTLFGSMKFENIYKRRNSVINHFKRKQRMSLLNMTTPLT